MNIAPMENFLIYLFESSLCFSILYGIYFIALRKETFFKLNRFILLTIAVLSVLIPLLNIPVSIPLTEEIKATTMSLSPIYSTDISEGFISGNVSGENLKEQINYNKLIVLFYTSVVALLLCLFFYRFIKLLFLIRSGRKIKTDTYTIVLTEKSPSISSFFHYILWNKKEESLSDDNSKKIIQHELAHIKQVHSLDILFSEFFKIIFWFNPLSYCFQRSLREVHEYSADEEALTQEANKTNYCKLITQESLKEYGISLSNSFNQSQLKRRLAMISKTKSKSLKKWKVVLVVPIVISMVLIFSCSHKEELSLSTSTKLKTNDIVKLIMGKTIDEALSVTANKLNQFNCRIENISTDEATNSPVHFNNLWHVSDQIISAKATRKNTSNEQAITLKELRGLYAYMKEQKSSLGIKPTKLIIPESERIKTKGDVVISFTVTENDIYTEAIGVSTNENEVISQEDILQSLKFVKSMPLDKRSTPWTGSMLISVKKN